MRTVKSVRQQVASLSGGQRQTVAIAKAVLWDSKVVILDEPTAALGVAQTRQVLDLVRRLADTGHGVILISHNMNDVFEVADRISTLYLGRVAADVARSDVTTARSSSSSPRAGPAISGWPATAAESIEFTMSTETPQPTESVADTPPAADSGDSAFSTDTRVQTVSTELREYWARLRAGDLGSLPAIFGLVVLVILFTDCAPGRSLPR